jgi:hypothetical protein
MKDTLITLAYALMLIVLYFGAIDLARVLTSTTSKEPDMQWCQIQFNDSKADIPCERVSRLD